jgi:hypothetical protein
MSDSASAEKDMSRKPSKDDSLGKLKGPRVGHFIVTNISKTLRMMPVIIPQQKRNKKETTMSTAQIIFRRFDNS